MVQQLFSSGSSIDVDASGQLTSNNTAAAVRDASDPSKLNFNTTTITIDPMDFTGFYAVGLVSDFLREQQSVVTVVSNLNNYSVVVGVSGATRFFFSVDSIGQPDPTSVIVTVESESFTFNVCAGSCNQAPSITSASAVTVAENQTAVIDVQSTDPEGATEGDGLTYSLSGGAELPILHRSKHGSVDVQCGA